MRFSFIFRIKQPLQFLVANYYLVVVDDKIAMALGLKVLGQSVFEFVKIFKGSSNSCQGENFRKPSKF
jgi:hypothetical protein